MKMQRFLLPISLLILGLLGRMTATAAASEATCYATANGGGRVFSADSAYAVQRAADQTFNTDGIVRIAGYCPGNILINDRTLIFRGGYSPSDWTLSDPKLYPTVLEGVQQLSVVRISAPNDSLTFENLSITGGTAYRGGGIQVNDVVSLTLRDVTLYDNHAVDYGGGLFVAGGNVLIEHSRIYGNHSELYGGGIYSNQTVTLADSTIADNGANELGGGIYNSGSGQLNIENTTLSHNTVYSSVSGGGGIFNRGTLMMKNSTVSGNSAETQSRRILGTGGGGGLWNNGGTASLIHTTFANNRADSNGGYAFGGAVFNNNGGTLSLVRNLFADNVGGGCINLSTIAINTSNADEDGSCEAAIVGELDLPPLADNGGATQTHALDPAHAAVDVMGEVCLSTDQRGVKRKQPTACDVGAFEFVEEIPTAVAITKLSTDSINLTLLSGVALALITLTTSLSWIAKKQ